MTKLATAGILALALAVGACAKHDATDNAANAIGNDTAVTDGALTDNVSDAENAAELTTGNGANVTP